MRVADGVFAVIIAAFAVLHIRSGVMEWRKTGTPLSQRTFTSFLDPETRAGLDRGGLMMGLAFAFMALAFAAGAVAFPHPTSEVQLIAGEVALAALFVFTCCLALALLIINFNRPKLLVPPQHRGELGAIAARRRLRRSLQVLERTGHRPDGHGGPGEPRPARRRRTG